MNDNQIENNEIWLIIDSRHFGGIESHVIELALGLIRFKKRVRVILIKQYDSENQLLLKLKKAQLSYLCLDERYPNTALIFAFKHLVNLYQPSIVHAHGYKASLLCKVVCLATSTKMAVTYHAGETPVGRVKLYDALDRYSARLSPTRFSVSSAIDSKIWAKTQVLNNFVSIPEQTVKQGQYIAFAGRLSFEKAPDRFLSLAKQFPEQRFILYGEGDMKASLQAEAPINVTFAGYTQMAEVWSEIDLLIIPSRFEGLPMVALEAMVRTIPVVAMNVGALNQLILSNQNGWICDDKSQLAQAISSWLNLEKEKRSQMKQACRSKIENEYSDSKVIPQILSHYKIPV
jgi:glycosyltransferase involved in cell wall biosynthesis